MKEELTEAADAFLAETSGYGQAGEQRRTHESFKGENGTHPKEGKLSNMCLE